jgi:hypothetical protein
MFEKIFGGKTKKQLRCDEREVRVDLGNLLNPQVQKYARKLDMTGLRDAVTRDAEVSYIPKKTLKSKSFGL